MRKRVFITLLTTSLVLTGLPVAPVGYLANASQVKNDEIVAETLDGLEITTQDIVANRDGKVYVPYGETATLEVFFSKIEDEDGNPIHYDCKWYECSSFDGPILPDVEPIVGTTRIEVENVTGMRYFICYIKNEAGIQTQYGFEVGVDDHLMVKSQDKTSVYGNMNTVEGKAMTGLPYTMQVQAIDTSQPLDQQDTSRFTYQWWIERAENDEQGNALRPIEGATTDTYTLDKVEKKEYVQCVVTDPYGGEVRMFYIIEPDPGFEIKQSYETIFTHEGSEVVLKPEIYFYDDLADEYRNNLTYKWKKVYLREEDGAAWESEVVLEETGDSLTLTSADANATYTVTVKNQFGAFRETSFRVLPYGASNPICPVESFTNVYAPIGVPTDIQVDVYATPGMNVAFVWGQEGADPITTTAVAGPNGIATGVLENQIVTDETKIYYMTVYDAEGSPDESFSFSTYVRPDTGLRHGVTTTNRMIRPGREITLDCGIVPSEQHNYTYQWGSGYFSADNPDNTYWMTGVFEGETGQTFTSSDGLAGHLGSDDANRPIFCIVTDEFGTSQCFVYNLYVKVGINVYERPAEDKILLTDDETYSVGVAARGLFADSEYYYYWMEDGKFEYEAFSNEPSVTIASPGKYTYRVEDRNSGDAFVREIKVSKPVMQEMTNQQMVFTLSDDQKLVGTRFVPNRTGLYFLYTKGNDYPELKLYDENGLIIDNNVYSENALMEALEGGKTYYITCGYSYQETPGEYTLVAHCMDNPQMAELGAGPMDDEDDGHDDGDEESATASPSPRPTSGGNQGGQPTTGGNQGGQPTPSGGGQHIQPTQTPAPSNEPQTINKPTAATDGTTVTTSAKGEATVSSVKKSTKKAVTVPETVTVNKVKYKVTTIGANAFKNATKATTATLPKTVTKVKANAFKGSKITTVKMSVKKGGKLTVDRKAFKSAKVNKVVLTVSSKATTKEINKLKTTFQSAGIKGKKLQIKKSKKL